MYVPSRLVLQSVALKSDAVQEAVLKPQHAVVGTAPTHTPPTLQFDVEKTVLVNTVVPRYVHSLSIMFSMHTGVAVTTMPVPQHEPSTGSPNVGFGVGTAVGAGVGLGVVGAGVGAGEVGLGVGATSVGGCGVGMKLGALVGAFVGTLVGHRTLTQLVPAPAKVPLHSGSTVSAHAALAEQHAPVASPTATARKIAAATTPAMVQQQKSTSRKYGVPRRRRRARSFSRYRASNSCFCCFLLRNGVSSSMALSRTRIVADYLEEVRCWSLPPRRGRAPAPVRSWQWRSTVRSRQRVHAELRCTR
jgi:hypothetical protein